MISVVIPALNEEKAIYNIVKRVPRKIEGEKVEVIVVDNNSSDRTAELARKAGARVVSEKERGKGNAMKTGVKNSLGNKIVFLDGDGTYPPELIPELVGLLNKCDMAVGSRLLAKETAKDLETYLLYRIIPRIWRLYKNFKTSEPITGMRAIRKSDWNKLEIKAKGFLIEPEIEVKAVRNKFKIIEIPVPCIKRIGKSKFSTSPKSWIQYTRYVNKYKRFLRRMNKKAKVYRIIEY